MFLLLVVSFAPLWRYLLVPLLPVTGRIKGISASLHYLYFGLVSRRELSIEEKLKRVALNVFFNGALYVMALFVYAGYFRKKI